MNDNKFQENVEREKLYEKLERNIEALPTIEKDSISEYSEPELKYKTSIDQRNILDEIKNKLQKLPKKTEITGLIEEMGKVVGLGDGIVEVVGLSNCMVNEMLYFENGEVGLALNLNEDSIGVIILGDYSHIEAGNTVRRSGALLEVPVSNELLGRLLNPLGEALDGRPQPLATAKRPIESPAPDVMARQSVSVPLQTGIIAIDALIPIGRGQRELIIGDRKTGKTTLAIDTIINQAGQDVICIYVAIGQKESSIKEVYQTLEERGALDYTLVVMASASDSTALQYLAPYSACAIGEYFMRQGRDVLIVYDDLSKHAVAYRELSLLLKRPPGREAYPGDVFYLHSRLLERAACLSDAEGGGSITALPIIETQYGDVSAYIPTNVISITDGQIFLDSDLFKLGQRPAVNVGISVSRVGSSAQKKGMKQNAGQLRLQLAQYRELSQFTKFGSDFDEQTTKRLAKGERLMKILVQKKHQTYSLSEQIMFLFAAHRGYLDKIEVDDIPPLLKKISKALYSSYTEVIDELESGAKIQDDLEKQMLKCLDDVFNVLANMPYPKVAEVVESEDE